jgi:hypothetical protein
VLLGHLHDILQRARGQKTVISKGHNRRLFHAYLSAADHCRQVISQSLHLCTCLPLHHFKLFTALDNCAKELGRRSGLSHNLFNFHSSPYKGVLLGRCYALMGHPSPTSAVNAAGAIACSAIVGRSYAALLSASRAAPAPALARPTDVAMAFHNPSSPRSPSSSPHCHARSVR